VSALSPGTTANDTIRSRKNGQRLGWRSAPAPVCGESFATAAM
jgi:hypothetical protein